MERTIQLAASKDNHKILRSTDEPCRMEAVRRYFCTGLESLDQFIDVHRFEVNFVGVEETVTPHEGELAHKREWPPLEVGGNPATTTRILALRTAASGLALSGGNTTPDTLPALTCPLSGM